MEVFVSYDVAKSVPCNPKDAVGSRKTPVTTIPMNVMSEVGLALFEGARKYGKHNWRSIDVFASVYIDAAWRHLSLFWEGEDIDPDSGLSHVTKAIAGLIVLRDAMSCGKWEDDRPIKSSSGWMNELNEKASGIVERYPDAKEPFTELGNGKGMDSRRGREDTENA